MPKADLTWGVVSTIKAPARDILRFAAYHLDLGAQTVAVALAKQPRGDHLGIVQHQTVAGLQQVGQIMHMTVGHRIAHRMKQPRRRAWLDRTGGDQAVGQIKVEISNVGCF